MLISLQSWRQDFNKAAMNLALSTLFSFRCVAAELMCVSQIFMEYQGRLAQITDPPRVEGVK